MSSPARRPDEAMERLEELAARETPPGDAAWTQMLEIAATLAEVDALAERYENRDTGVIEFTTERLQVSLFEHESSVTVPYWSDGKDGSDSRGSRALSGDSA